MNQLLTVKEVSKILRVNEETVRRYAKRGVLPHITLPKGKNSHPVYRIRQDTLNIFIDDGYSEYTQAAS